MIGGLVRLICDKTKRKENEKKEMVSNGILFCSGMIAGEGLAGIVLAMLAVAKLDFVIDVSEILNLSSSLADAGSLVVLALIIFCLLKFTIFRKQN